MNKKQIEVNATVRIVATVKGKPLTDTENFTCKVSLFDMPYPKDVLEQTVRVDVADKFEAVFLERMKKVPAVKNFIGGTKWKVEVTSAQYESEGVVA